MPRKPFSTGLLCSIMQECRLFSAPAAEGPHLRSGNGQAAARNDQSETASAQGQTESQIGRLRFPCPGPYPRR